MKSLLWRRRRNWVDTNLSEFCTWSSTLGVRHLVGDFNADGRSDIALLGFGLEGQTGRTAIALAQGDGSWKIVKGYVSRQVSMALGDSSVTALVGDYNSDGATDIAVTGAPEWTDTMPVISLKWGQFVKEHWHRGNAFAPSAVPGSIRLSGNFWKWR